MIVEKDVIKFSNNKEEKIYKCKNKLIALSIKKLLRKDKDIRIIKINLRQSLNIMLYNLIVLFWSYADRIEAEKLLREKYIFVPYGYDEYITNK